MEKNGGNPILTLKYINTHGNRYLVNILFRGSKNAVLQRCGLLTTKQINYNVKILQSFAYGFGECAIC